MESLPSTGGPLLDTGSHPIGQGDACDAPAIIPWSHPHMKRHRWMVPMECGKSLLLAMVSKVVFKKNERGKGLMMWWSMGKAMKGSHLVAAGTEEWAKFSLHLCTCWARLCERWVNNSGNGKKNGWNSRHVGVKPEKYQTYQISLVQSAGKSKLDKCWLGLDKSAVLLTRY